MNAVNLPISVELVNNSLVLKCDQAISGSLTLYNLGGRILFEMYFQAEKEKLCEFYGTGVFLAALRSDLVNRTLVVTNIK